MIAYRELGQPADPRVLLEDCRRAARAGDLGDLLVAYGEFEAAVADALFPREDDLHPLAAAMRRVALAVARRYRGERLALEPLFEALARAPLPQRVIAMPAEGYAFYGLLPENYLEAAARFARARPPGNAICIGLRSIGASLSALVGAELAASGWRVELLTLRPRGAPFARAAALSRGLRRRLHRDASAWLLIVDEGPGLSGSSFAGVAAALGAPDRRVVFFPSWLPDGAQLASPQARERWARHEKAHAAFDAARLWPGARDLSGGAWRRLLGVWPAVLPQHERRKHLTPDGRLFRFAGLGRHGRETRERAVSLAEARFAPPTIDLNGGFLEQRFVRARPMRRGEADGAFLAHAARYLAWRGRSFALDRAADPAPLQALQEANLGSAPPPPPAARAVLLDNRLAPHEWLRTPDGWLKADAADHADDHFFPGPHDLAWDVAGFIVEFALPRAAAADFAAAVAAGARDPTLPERLPFYRRAYLAAQIGYAALARAALGAAPDARRFAMRARRMRHVLARTEPPLPGRRC